MTHTLQSIRESFISFFQSKNHMHLASYPLVPQNDPTLLFVNSGMAPLKEFFLGITQPPAKTLVTCQKCLRVGGKHNDLEQIGYTKRHHTFFEMLGNFSFGGYFKEEAISYAWEFITEYLKLDKSRLYATVHTSDEQSYELWKRYLSEDKITKLDANFWFMGDEGPCGPCTEIFYDLGEHLEGCQPGKGEEGDRFLEIWNLVFMMYEQSADGSRKELPQKCVDTGAGLERLAAVLNNTDDTFNIPDMKQLTDYIEKVTNLPLSPAHKVLADHARSVAFLFADGVMPGAEGRAYILRKLIRRAARFGYKMTNSMNSATILEELLPMVYESMKHTYPELLQSSAFALQVLKDENERFLKVLEIGIAKIDDYMKHNIASGFSGEFAFMLYDTYGFPIEILNDIARENNMQVDLEGFEVCITQQRDRSKKAWQGTGDMREKIDVSAFPATVFLGYEQQECDATVLAVFSYDDDSLSLKAVEGLEAVEECGQNSKECFTKECFILLDKTVFYGESGGQIADLGVIIKSHDEYNTVSNTVLNVEDVQIMPNKTYLHKVKIISGAIKVQDQVHCKIDIIRRNKLRKYHTATHLLHAALRTVLGEHITQKGSLVEPNRLRFDFAHGKAMTEHEIKAVEDMINHWIALNLSVNTAIDTPQAAVKNGAMALFGEKYPEKVRVVTVGDTNNKSVSVELCGGTHVASTGLIKYFRIMKESSCAAGIRRIEALCGSDLVHVLDVYKNNFESICRMLKTDTENVQQKIEKLLSTKNTQSDFDINVSEGVGIKKAVVNTSASAKELTDILQQAIKKTSDINAWIVLSNSSEKVSFIIYLDKKGKEVFGNANDLLSKISYAKGGGKPELVQGVVDASNKQLLLDFFLNL